MNNLCWNPLFTGNRRRRRRGKHPVNSSPERRACQTFALTNTQIQFYYIWWKICGFLAPFWHLECSVFVSYLSSPRLVLREFGEHESTAAPPPSANAKRGRRCDKSCSLRWRKRVLVSPGFSFWFDPSGFVLLTRVCEGQRSQLLHFTSVSVPL